MKSLGSLIVVFAMGMVHAGCAKQPAVAQPGGAAVANAAAPSVTAAAPQKPTLTLDGQSSRVLVFPTASGPGKPMEATVLLDEPALKLATIVLRGGKAMPTHHAEVPVTIMALSGSGSIVIGTERLPIDTTHAVVLAPHVAHAVEPDAGTDLVVLVHHLGQGEEHQP